MKIVIYTNIRENYGVHDWDGEGECPQYWKNKGGDIYVLEGTLENFDEVAPLIESISDSYEELVAHRVVLEDDEAVIKQDWEAPWTIKNVAGEWIAERWQDAEDWWNPGYKGKYEIYTMLPSGDRTNYKCEYVELEVA